MLAFYIPSSQVPLNYATFSVLTQVFIKIQVFQVLGRVSWCTFTEVSQKLAAFIFRVVHILDNPEDECSNLLRKPITIKALLTESYFLHTPPCSLQVRCPTSLQKPGSYFKIRGDSRVRWNKFHSEGSQILGITVQNLVAWTTWRQGFLHRWFKPLTYCPTALSFSIHNITN